MQAKLEKFIHDFGNAHIKCFSILISVRINHSHNFIALRKTMLKAHRRAWLWQDEWYGLTMDDIREIERQTQEILRSKMAAIMGPGGESGQDDKSQTQQQEQNQAQQRANDNRNTASLAATLGSIEKSEYDVDNSSAVTKRHNTNR